MAGPALVTGQQGATSSSANNCTVTLPSPITAGNMLVAVAVTDNSTQPGTSVISDTSGSNTWTRVAVAGNSANGGCVGIYVSLNVAAGSYGIKFTNTSTFVGLSVGEYTPNGLSGTDGTAGNQATISGTPAPGNITTTNADDVLLAGATDNLSNTTWSAGGSWNLRGNVTSSSNTTVALQDRTLSSTGTFATSFGNSAANGWAAAAAAIKAASAGPTFIAPPVVRAMQAVNRACRF